MGKLAIDFGTSNTVVVAWQDATSAPETLQLPGLSTPVTNGQPALVPSLLYVLDGQAKKLLVGQAVRDAGYDVAGDARLFRSFKRGIAANAHPLPREIDGSLWGDPEAGRGFLTHVSQIASRHSTYDVEELVLTVPVQAFDKYLKWLQDGTIAAPGTHSMKQMRIVDEATAAALGYDVHGPNALILVVDFGGGTLDVALVRMPADSDREGLTIPVDPRGAEEQALSGAPAPGVAHILAKAGTLLGGDDIDNWLIDALLERNASSREAIGASYPQLKSAVEAAKIGLSRHESADVSVTDVKSNLAARTTFTRPEFEALLVERGLFSTLQRIVDKTLRSARQKGISPEDIDAILLVGGTSLIPSVGRHLRTMFAPDRVHEHRPFEAIAHGALILAAGFEVKDILYHSYGIRHRVPGTPHTEYEEIIPAGSRYPLAEPVDIILTASQEGQDVIEVVIGEVEEDATGLTEVMFGEHAILMVENGVTMTRVVPLNDTDGARTLARLDPSGVVHEDRIRATFNVDPNRMLRVTVTDLLSNRILLYDMPVVELR